MEIIDDPGLGYTFLLSVGYAKIQFYLNITKRINLKRACYFGS